MKKLLMVLLVPTLLFCSEKPESGKLPKDFQFRNQDEEGVSVRISFIRQWQDYQEKQDINLKSDEALDINVNYDNSVYIDKKTKDKESK